MYIDEILKKKNEVISDSNPEWQAIKQLSSAVQKEFNDNGFLTSATLFQILQWRLVKRGEKIRKNISEPLLKNITQCYAAIEHPDENMQIRIKTHVLQSIPWTGIVFSSALMALHQPHLYGAIDARGWNLLFDKNKKSFGNNDYLKYLTVARNVASEMKCDVLQVDYTLWKLSESK